MERVRREGPERSGAAPGRAWRRAVPLALLATLALAAGLAFAHRLDVAALAAAQADLRAFRDAHYALAAVAFVAAYAAIAALALPAAALASLTGGFLFGIFPGVLFNVLAATLGAVALFLAVRAGFGARLSARLDAAGGRVGRLKAELRRDEIPVLLALRLVPAVPFAVANVVPALIGVGLGRFAATTAIGILPGALVYTAAGAGLGEVLAAGEEPDLGLIFRPSVLLPLLGLAALAALPAALRRLRRGG